MKRRKKVGDQGSAPVQEGGARVSDWDFSSGRASLWLTRCPRTSIIGGKILPKEHRIKTKSRTLLTDLKSRMTTRVHEFLQRPNGQKSAKL